MATGFKQIQVTENEWLRYKRLADELAKDVGVKVHINGLIKKAVDVYEAETSKNR